MNQGTVLRPYLLGCSLAAALGGLLFGFDTAVISGTTGALRAEFGLTDGTLGFTVASALIGTILGALFAGKPADWLGRRPVLALLGVFYFLSAVGCAFAWNWGNFLAFRFLGGLAVGGASVVSPLYTAEISPAKFRGRMVAMTQFNVVLRILLAYVSNYFIGQQDFGETAWRWMFGVEAAPALLFLFLVFLIPRSPRWLIARGRLEEAKTVFAKVGTDTGNLDSEILEIQKSLDLEHHSLKERFFPLGDERDHRLDLSRHRRGLRDLVAFCLLHSVHGGAVALGDFHHARDEGSAARENSGRTRNPVRR